MKTLRIFVALLAFLANCAWADSTPVGTVKTVSGDALIVTAGSPVKAALGVPVYLGSQLRTGPKSSLGIVFNDATVTSIGAQTELTIDEYLFQPAPDKQKFAAKLLKGSMNYLSGAIAKLNPASVRLQTPTGTLGVRGTQLLALVDGSRSFVTLIADPNGVVGQVLIQGARGNQLIDVANFSAPLDGSSPPTPVDASTTLQDFADVIQARPVQPALPTPGTAGPLGGAGAGAPLGAGGQAGVAATLGGISAPALSFGVLVLGVGVSASQGSSGTSGTAGQ